MFYSCVVFTLLGLTLVSCQPTHKNVNYFYSCPNSVNCAYPVALNQNLETKFESNVFREFRNPPISRRSRKRMKNSKKTTKKLHTPPPGTALAERQHTKLCDGWENFLEDAEIVLLGVTIVSFVMSLFALTLHTLNQAYIFLSVHIVGTPERLIWLIERIAPGITNENVHLFFEVIGFFDYLVIRWISFPVGNWIVVIEVLGHIIGGGALFFDLLIPFEDVVRTTIKAITGINLKAEFAGYGCNNPYEAPVGNALANFIPGSF